MTRNTEQHTLADAPSGLSVEQAAHLQDLEAKRRAMAAIRRGSLPTPNRFDVERERKLEELRAAGHLGADQ